MGNYFKKSICMLLVFIMSLSPAAENIKIVYANQIVDNQDQIDQENKTNTEDDTKSDDEKQITEENTEDKNIEEENTQDEEEAIEDNLDNHEPIENSMQIEQADFTTIEIRTVQELKDISKNLSGNYVLMNDIDLNNEEWMPIGSFNYSFTGTFNGNGYKIKNLKVTNYNELYGLFGRATNSTIENLTIENININGKTFVGALGGVIVHSTIKNCSVIGDGSIIGEYRVGGIVGHTDNTFIEECYTSIDISGFGNEAGGLLGRNHRVTTVKNSYSISNVIGGGGLVGYRNEDATKIINSYFAGRLVNKTQKLSSDAVILTNSYVLGLTESDFSTDTSNIVKTPEELQDKNNFLDWNFNDVWEMSSRFKYPVLKYFEQSKNIQDGTVTNPFLIADVNGLKNINNNLSAHYKLINNIDLNSEEWLTLGDVYNPFKGTFNGNGFIIKNLNINRASDYQGLFGAISYGTIKNVIIENVTIDANNFTGAIIGRAEYSTIENCAVVGDGYVSGTYYVGGLVGYMDSTTLDQCYTSVGVNGTDSSVGGILGRGFTSTTIKNSFSKSNVNGGGALVGNYWIESGNKIENSYFTGTLLSKKLVLCDVNINIISSYFNLDNAHNGNYAQGEQAKTTEQLKQKSTYQNWDFDKVWYFVDDYDYPVLRSMKVLPNGKEVTTNIPKVPNFRYELYPTSVLLKWDDNTTDTFSHFSIEQKDSLNGNYVGIGTTNTKLGYEVKNILPDKEYWFRVCVYDKSGNRGEYAELHVTTSNDTSNPIINSIEPGPGRFNATIPMVIKASDNGTIKEIIVEIATTNDGEFTNLLTKTINPPTSSITEKLDIDTTKLVEGVHYVNVKIKDNEGNETKQQIPYYVDRTKPSTPNGLTVEVASSHLNIIWSEQLDTLYFTLYRKDETNTDFVLYKDNITTRNYIDENVVIGKTYAYKVTATDHAGNVSDVTEVVTGIPIEDTVAPTIYGVSPASGSDIGINAQLNITAYDNHALKTIVAEYNDGAEWKEIGREEARSKGFLSRITWDNKSVSDGSKELRFYAIDTSGNKSEYYTATYNLKNMELKQPELSLVPGGMNMKLVFNNGGNSDVVAYTVYRYKDGKFLILDSFKSNISEYIDENLDPTEEYTYIIEVIDKYGNQRKSEQKTAKPLNEDTKSPVANAGSNFSTIVGKSTAFDGTLSTDNVGIVSYEWSFGDGKTSKIAKPNHTFEETGTYTVRLKVTDAAGNNSTSTIDVLVLDESQTGSLVLKVIDKDTKLPLSKATVYIDYPDMPMSYTTDSSGEVKIYTNPGKYKVSAYIKDYIPKMETKEVTQYEESKATIELKKGEFLKADIKTERLSLEEIKSAGIDVDNPANQYVYNFDVTIKFGEQKIPHRVITNGIGEVLIDYGTPSGYYVRFIPIPNHPEIPPSYAVIKIPVSVTFLKEFFDVELTIVNLAQNEFVMIKNEAKLNIPEGLLLAKTADEQKITAELDDLPGGKSEIKHSWILYGDKPGDYNLTIDYKGILMPFEAPIETTFKTDKPLTVNGGKGLKLYFYLNSKGEPGKEYEAEFTIANESKIDFNNVTVKLGNGTDRLNKKITVKDPITGKPSEVASNGITYSIKDIKDTPALPQIQSGDSVKIATLKAGQSLTAKYVTIMPKAEGTATSEKERVSIFEKSLNMLKEAFAKSMDGTNSDVEIIFLSEPYKTRDFVVVDRGPITSGVLSGVSPLGILNKQWNMIDLRGVSYMPFYLTYNSGVNTKSETPKEEGNEEGQPEQKPANQSSMGMGGFANNYDMKVVPSEDGALNLFLGNSYVRFSNALAEKTTTTGKIVGDTVEVSNDIATLAFKSAHEDYKNYTLTKTMEGVYELLDEWRNKYYFDAEGNLTKVKDKTNKSILINRALGYMTVTDNGTGKTLTAYYNSDNVVTKINDNYGREASFSYNNNMLTSIKDLNGQTTSFEYDPSGRLSKISAGGRVQSSYEYDDEGRVVKEFDGEGNMTTYSYDTKTDFFKTIVTKTDRNGNTSIIKIDNNGNVVYNKDALGNETLYTFDEKGYPASVIDANDHATMYSYDTNGNLTKVTDAEGSTQEMTYDENNNMLTHKLKTGAFTEYKYNENNQVIESTDERGAKSTYTYNEKGQVESKTVEGLGTAYYGYKDGMLEYQTDFESNTTWFTYDDTGMLESVRDPEGYEETYDYWNDGKLSSVINKVGGKTNYYYDIDGNLQSEEQPSNESRISYDYDKNNRVIGTYNRYGRTGEFKYDPEGNLIEGINPDDGVYTYEYDAAGRLIKQVDPNGGVTTLEYDPVGQVISKTPPDTGQYRYSYYRNGVLKTETDPNGNTTTYYYNDANQLSRVEDEHGKTVHFEYDTSGNLIKTTDASGISKSSEFDKYNRLIKEIDPNGNVTSYEYTKEHQVKTVIDPLYNVTEMIYDKNGRLSKTIDANGGTTTVKYNGLGNAIEVTNPLGNTVSADYNSKGNLIELRDAYGTVVQKIEYDLADRPIKSTDAFGNSKTTEYNKVNEVIENVNELNNSTTYDYDKLGNMLSSTDAEGNKISFSYDKANRMTTFRDQTGGVTELTYDLVGRLTEEKMASGGIKVYNYDELNRLTKIETARKQYLELIYDQSNRLVEFAGNKYTYDNNGNILTVTNANGTTRRTYDELNRVVKFTDVNDKTITYTYDKMGNLKTVTYPTGEIVSYVYDSANQLTLVTDYAMRQTKYTYNKNGALVETQNSNNTKEVIAYDIMSRPVTKTITTAAGDIVTKYEYDKAGNIISENIPDIPNTVPKTAHLALANKLMTFKAGNQVDTYNGKKVTYDADGNMTNGPLKGVMTDYKYNELNQLTSVGDTTYKYDGEGTRISQTYKNGSITYVTDVNTALSRVLQTTENGKIKLYVYGLGLISEEEVTGATKANFRVYHYDYRGSTIMMTNQSGAMTDHFMYDAYGELLSSAGNTKTAFLYVGKYGVETDQNGLIYMRARYYNTDTQRFVNEDPVKDGLNWYGYVNGDPVRFVDLGGQRPSDGYDYNTGKYYDEKGNYDKKKTEEFKKYLEKIYGKSTGKKVYSVYSLTEEEKIFIATIFGETSVGSNSSGIAVANVIMNRLNPIHDKTGYWKKYTTVTDIIANTGFDAYTRERNDPNSNYSQAMNYMNNPNSFNGYPKIPQFIDELIKVCLPIYYGEVADITQGSVYYYSPKLQSELHRTNPDYKSTPDFLKESVELVKIKELSPNDDFAFYRYK